MFVATVLALLAAGLLASAHDADHRKTLRMPEWSMGTGDAAFYAYNSIMDVQDIQFTALWVEPGPEFSDDVIPPGLAEFPGPGEAAVSPGLADAGVTAGDLGFSPAASTSGVPGVIGDEGVESPGEYFVYLRAPEGADLGDPEQLLYFSGYPEIPATQNGASWFSLDPPIPPMLDLLPFVLVMLVAPAFVLAATAMRMHSTHREDRHRILRELGVPPRRILGLQIAEGIIEALPGVALGIVATQTVTMLTGRLPGAPAEVFRGELQPPWWAVGLWCVICLGAVVLGVLLDAVRSRKRMREGEPERTSPLWALLLLGIVVLTGLVQSPLGSSIAPSERAALFMGAAIGVVLLLPSAMPFFVRAVARRATAPSHPTLSIALARARHAPLTIARGGAMLALMIFLGTFALSLIASRQATAEEAGTPELATVFWMQEDPSTVPAVQVGMESIGGAAYPLGAAADGGEVVVVTSCNDPVIELIGLDDEVCHQVIDAPRAAAEKFLPAGYEGPLPVTRAETSTASAVIVVPAGTTQTEVFGAVAPRAAGLSVVGLGTSQVHYFLLRWYTYLLLLGIGALWFALCRDMGDRTLRGLEERSVLFRIGVPEKFAWRIVRLEVAVPSIIAFGLAVLLGVAAGGVGQEIGLTLLRLRDVLLVAAVGAGSALCAALLVSFGAQRAAHRGQGERRDS